MPALSAAQLLSVWEHGARRHPLDRALLLFAVAEPGLAPDALADAPLGACNAALMRLRRDCFGAAIPAWTDCPACGERMSFELDLAQLPAMTPVPDVIEVEGHRFRCPGTRQLAALADCPDADEASRQLLLDCVAGDARLTADNAMLDQLLVHAEHAIEAADPWADLAVGYRCPACGHAGEAAFDIASYLWEEIEAHASRLLDEVHLLASSYGWREEEILALGDVRRAAYLARVTP
jgi:rubredoxin